MKKDFSPEERLLRLIKGSKKKEAPENTEAATRVQPSSAILPPQERVEAKTTKAASISLPTALRGLNTRVLNSILILILTGGLLYFGYDFYGSHQIEEVDFSVANGPVAKADEKEGSLDIKPSSFYSSSVEGRNIFMPQQTEATIEEVITGPTAEEISAGLSLIGIIAGSRPQAIIEDKKSGKSHFLYRGGSIGKATITEILEDSVVMEYQGQTFELVL